uniref:GDNF/GAS1 domain-containing protein n=1 Tax=Anopheles funestus TaxID=62324 RepID=A0A1I8JU53_ANOFN
MRSKCYVHRRQRLAASTAKDQGGWDTVGEENGRTGRRPARTRVAGPRRMSLGAAMLLVIVLGPALDVRQRPSTSVSGSEFPERECCDPVYPPMPDPEPVPGPAYPTTTISTSSSFQTGQSGMGGGGLLGGSGGIGGAGGGSTAVGNELGGGLIGTGSGSQLSSSRPMHIGYSGSNIKTAIAILNCILARQLCFEDPSCSAILEIIPRVCGPVPVACSTVTVTKCQAALRTLQAFPFFRPTCLCKEPGMDPDCNYFRDFLFDHPCGFVSKKEKDPYPVDALPTCNHALSVCQQERKCIKLFEDFKLHCKVRENKCRMEDRDLCYEAWTNLRLSPMFGCICPNNHMKRRCDKIFSVVNHNPCVVRAMGVDDNYHRLLDQNMALIETPLVAPPHAYYPQHYKTALYPYNVSGYHHLHQHGTGGHFGNHQHQHPHSYGGFEYEYATGGGVGGGIGGPGTGGYLAASAGSAPVDNILISLNGGNGDAAIELDGSSYEHTMDKQFGSDDIEEKEAEMSFIHFQSTCHLALDSCRDDQVCSSALKTVLMHCDQHRCNRNACMESLQSFYKSIHDDLSLDIAFCLCRKTPNRHDSCMIAQEKLHPVCAQRPPESLSQQSSSTGNGIAYNAPPACHAVAELCREDEDCRARLEVFEQSCAVDSVTKKCAGKTSACRQAMLGILGTPLRTTCACQGSDMQQLYDCLGWQRLLWLNPCVVESQKDFHLKRLAELGLLTTTTTMATTTTTIATTTTLRTTRVTQPPTPPPTKPKPVYRPKPTEMHTVESNYVETPDTRPETLVHNQNGVIERSDIDRGHQHPPPDEYDRSTGTRHQSVDSDSEDDMTGQYGKEIYQRPDEQVLHVASTEVQEVETLPPTTITTTTTEPTTTPVPIRYCVVQRSHQPDQLIAEGKSRRLYILDDAECSELCTCGGGDSLALTCHALCVPLAPCRTALAYYSHAAPAYQAFRGRCLCYSGRFICMRPPPGEYQLPGGIFLLLGYSSTDEALLRPHTNLGVQDAVRALQQYVLQHIDNSTLCTLTLFNITEENIILSIRLPLDPKLTPMQLLKLEKDQCTRILEAISHQINTQYVELSAHRLLSIFKMAEVQIVWPEVSYARRHTTPSLVVSLMTGVATVLLTLCGTLVPPFVRWTQHHQRWPAASRLVT